MRRSDWLLVGAACVAFLVASSWQISLPGLQYDECIGAASAVNFVRGTENAEPMHIRPSVIRPFGRPLPLMQMTYIGPVKTLLYLPVFALAGISPATVRALPILAALGVLALTYVLCLRLLGRRVAVASLALLTLEPSFVFYLSRDVGPAALQVLLKLVGLLFFVRWFESAPRPGQAPGGAATWSFIAGAFAFGLGVSHKADFLWVVGGVALALAVVAPGQVLKRLRLPTLGWGLLSFLLGALPVVVLNLASGGRTFAPFLNALATAPGRHLAGFSSHLGERLGQLVGLLNGDFVARFFTGETPGLGVLRLALPVVLVLSLALLVALLGTRSPVLERPAVVGGILVYLTSVLIATCFSPGQLSGHHLLALYPMLHVAVGAALVSLERLAGTAWMRRLPGVVVVGLLLVDALTVVSIHRLLARTGGTGWWSDAIYALSEELTDRRRTVAVMDWGLANNLMVLSQGELPMVAVYREFWRPPVTAEVLAPYVEEEWLYLFHAPRFAWYRTVFDLFGQAAASQGLELVPAGSFSQRDGEEVYKLFRLRAKARSSSR